MRNQRITMICYVECSAPDFMFLPYGEMTSEQQDALVPINCEGHGEMSIYCDGCDYGRVTDEWIDDAEDI